MSENITIMYFKHSNTLIIIRIISCQENISFKMKKQNSQKKYIAGWEKNPVRRRKLPTSLTPKDLMRNLNLSILVAIIYPKKT